jgi:hypothetical protein
MLDGAITIRLVTLNTPPSLRTMCSADSRPPHFEHWHAPSYRMAGVGSAIDPKRTSFSLIAQRSSARKPARRRPSLNCCWEDRLSDRTTVQASACCRIRKPKGAYCGTPEGDELGPGGPAGPAGPGGPASPFSPFSPGSPLGPGSPFSPGGPVSPFSPFDP